MELHPDEQVVFEGHPSWRAVLSFYIGGVAGALVIAVIVFFVVSTFAAVVVFAVLVALVVLAGMIKRTSTDYMVSTQRLYIRRGILSKKVQQTRIDRVQNVNTDQSLRERLLRVGTVDFDTAGTDDSEFRFVGISDPARVVAAVDRAQREAALAPRRQPHLAQLEPELLHEADHPEQRGLVDVLDPHDAEAVPRCVRGAARRPRRAHRAARTR